MKKSILVTFLFLQLIIVFGQYENALIPYRLKNKWGYCDINGNIKIKPIYEKALLFTTQGYAIIKKNGKFGIINTEGNYTCKPKFDSLSYGINKNNNEIENYFVVKKKHTDNSKRNNVNYKGENIMLSGWSEPNQWHCGGDVRSNYGNYFIDDKESYKNIVNYKEHFYFNKSYEYENYFYFTIKKDTFIYLDKEQGRSSTGILNSQLKEIVPFKYQRIEEFQGLFKVYPDGENDAYFGLYSTSGKELFSPHRAVQLNDSILLLNENDYRFGVFNLKRLSYILTLSYGKIILLKDSNNTSFLVSKNYKKTNNINYNNFYDYHLVQDENINVTDTVFKQIILRKNQDSSFFFAQTSEGWNKFNLLGEKIFKKSYNTLNYLCQFNTFKNDCRYSEDLFIVSILDNLGKIKFGVININDSILVPIEFESLDTFHFSLLYKGFFFKNLDYPINKFVASKNNRHGVITSENQILLPLIYKKLDLIEYSPFAFVELENGKYGYVNYITGVEYFKD